MSGDFTQSGNIAIYDKFSRADVAIKNGVDLVIELPFIYSISSSEYFAKGAISILNNLGIVDYICFGSECGDIKTLNIVAKETVNNSKMINLDLKENLKNGMSYAKAQYNAISKYFNESISLEISKPNNILAIEYLKQLILTKSNIKPYTIKRVGQEFNEVEIENKEEFLSATSIREYIKENNEYSYLKKYVPNEMYEVIKNKEAVFNDEFFSILKYLIIKNDNLKEINGVTEGIENKIIDVVDKSNSYDELIHNVKSKRYTMVKIKRILLNILLGITKSDFNLLNNSINYAHVLGISNKGKVLLSEITKKSSINLITKINNKILDELDEKTRKSLEFDIFATNIYSSLTGDTNNKDYTNKL